MFKFIILIKSMYIITFLEILFINNLFYIKYSAFMTFLMYSKIISVKLLA